MTVLVSLLAVWFAVLRHVSADDKGGHMNSNLSKEKDFQPVAELRKTFQPSEFFFDFNKNPLKTPGATLGISTIDTNKFLGTLPGDGVAHVLLTLEPCSIVQPHNHPQGTESSYIIEGELLFGLVEENGGREVSSVIKPGQSIHIPRGLMHFAQNLSCKRAQFIASFPHRDPGTQTTISSFFKLPMSVIRQTLGVDDDTVEKLRQAVMASPDLSVDPVCAKRCGIKSTRRMM